MGEFFSREARAKGSGASSGARAGIIATPHGRIETPAFVAVGTRAAVKALTPDEVRKAGVSVVLGNTYHLYLEPGERVVAAAGGLGKFMGWSGPTMTDSGGFQAFSLGAGFGKRIPKILPSSSPSLQNSHPNILENVGVSDGGDRGSREESAPLAVVTDEGVLFRSYRDGSEHFFTPERSIAIQHALGADIIFAFDECTSPLAPYEYQKEATARTHRWAKRSLRAHLEARPPRGEEQRTQALFGVVQGGRFEDLRRESARVIGALDFDGFGIGGSFGKEDIETAVGWVNEVLPEDKPRHLLGIGEPEDLFGAVARGCDLFDCVAPTRMARHGSLYTYRGKLNIRNADCVRDHSPIEAGCGCYTCTNFTRSYLAHLFRSGELLAYTLASIHNLFFIASLVRKMREAILAGSFESLRAGFMSVYGQSIKSLDA
ncbi:MAG: queuine tRNA-ribosyltransferase [Parcubacteria group bacterium Gr01-1014_72]|nr:MAG: queuine tRNA-ribosyltransferase [Parcubacteria group bacterium Gr01-1014_72]